MTTTITQPAPDGASGSGQAAANGGSPATPTSPTPGGAAESQPGMRTGRTGRPGRSLAGQFGLTLLHISALGVLGTSVLSVLFSFFATGIGTIPALGIGFVILVGTVYATYGVAWFETERVAALYRLDTPALRLRQPQQQGFGGWLRAILRQSIDGRMWRAISSLAIGTVFGLVVVALLQGAVSGFLIAAFGGVGGGVEIFGIPTGSIAFTLVGAALALAGAFGIVLLARITSIAIIGAGLREEQLERQVANTSRQREGAVRAADLERTRIERDLHDGVQPRLVSIAMTLGIARERIDEDPEQAKELVAEAHTSTKAAITELRQLARGIHASVLDDRGLDAALSALAARSHVPVVLDVRQTGRGSHEAETAVYFAIAESLTNAAKHSRASEVRVLVRNREGALWARIEDNGIGGATITPGGGLDGIMNRIIAAGGSASLDSPRGGPTALEVSVPCAS